MAITYVEVVFTDRETLYSILSQFPMERKDVRRNVAKLAVTRWALRELRMQKLLKEEEGKPPEYSIRIRSIQAYQLPETEHGFLNGKQDPFATFTLGLDLAGDNQAL